MVQPLGRARRRAGRGGGLRGNRRDAQALGIFGAPSYVLDGEVFWGQDRLDLLDDALASARAPFRAG